MDSLTGGASPNSAVIAVYPTAADASSEAGLEL